VGHKGPRQQKFQLEERPMVWEATPATIQDKVLELLKLLFLEEFRRREEVTNGDTRQGDTGTPSP